MEKITAAITGISGYVPDYVLTNEELEQMVDTNDEWITTRTGIKERRILKGEDQGTSVLAINAAKNLLEKTNTNPEEIDAVIVCTVTPDMLFPATSNIVAHHIGAVNAFGYDMSAACSGFIFSLATASQFIETGKYKKIILIGADKMSSIVDYTDRSTCILFGDAAGAVLLEPSIGFGVKDFIMRTDGSGEQYLHMKAGGSRRPPSHETIDRGEHFVFQDGGAVFKVAVSKMADVAVEIAEKNNLSSNEINWLVPHQANKRIIDATGKRMGIEASKVMVNIEKYGNTTNATIPLCIADYEKKLKKGDNLILAAFGGGFTWGSLYLKWAYDPK